MDYNTIIMSYYVTASLTKWSACLTTNHEILGSIPGTSTNLTVG